MSIRLSNHGFNYLQTFVESPTQVGYLVVWWWEGVNWQITSSVAVDLQLPRNKESVFRFGRTIRNSWLVLIKHRIRGKDNWYKACTPNPWGRGQKRILCVTSRIDIRYKTMYTECISITGSRINKLCRWNTRGTIYYNSQQLHASWQ